MLGSATEPTPERSGRMAPSDSQLLDILLNRHPIGDVARMLEERHAARERGAELTRELPPGIPQRTEAWYRARRGMLTASEFKIAAAPVVSQAYVMGKIFPRPFTSNEAMQWGCRFEDLACATYEHEQEASVREFGLLVHPDAPWIGASPDGVTTTGVMVEIKCPFSRRRSEIERRVEEGRPFPKNDRETLMGRYAPQCQGQLEVCGLEECDFVVCHIDRMDEELFWQMRRVSDARHRYAVVLDTVRAEVDGGGERSGALVYETAPVASDDEQLRSWIAGRSRDTVEVWFVHVRELGVTRVARDRGTWSRMRENLDRTKSAIDCVALASAVSVDAASDVGACNAPMFSEDMSEYVSENKLSGRRLDAATPAVVVTKGDRGVRGKRASIPLFSCDTDDE